MNQNKIKFVLIATFCSLSLACNQAQYLLLGMAGVQGQVDSLTQVAVPLETEAPTSTVTIAPTQANTKIEVATPQAQSSPTNPNEDILLGLWTGTAQWLCDKQPLWQITMNFMEIGTVTITLSGPSDPIVNNFPWFLDGNTIQILIDQGDWYGSIYGNTMTGSFVEDKCNGVWSVTKR